MIRTRAAVLVVLMAAVLAGCMPPVSRTYEFSVPASKDFSKCRAQCQQTRERCQHLCRNNETLCFKEAMNQADKAYLKYLQGQRTKGQQRLIDRNAFNDPLQCLKASCDCEADYRVCYEMCGGVIKMKQQPPEDNVN